MVDMAHFAGLGSRRRHPYLRTQNCSCRPATTTHKTLRETPVPVKALILCREQFAAGVAQAFSTASKADGCSCDRCEGRGIQSCLQPEFAAYATEVVTNAKVLADAIAAEGYRIISGGTDTHLMLIDVFQKGVLGSEAEHALGIAGITVNKNAIPYDSNPPMKPSGIRIGKPATDDEGDGGGGG